MFNSIVQYFKLEIHLVSPHFLSLKLHQVQFEGVKASGHNGARNGVGWNWSKISELYKTRQAVLPWQMWGYSTTAGAVNTRLDPTTNIVECLYGGAQLTPENTHAV
jgi:hypothetical protein